MRQRKSHPLTSINPLMPETSADYKRLKASVERIKLIDPIVIYEGMILDGRSRYRICCRLGKKATNLRFTQFKGTHREALEFIYAKNLIRKQLSEKQHQISSIKYFETTQPDIIELKPYTRAKLIHEHQEHAHGLDYIRNTQRYITNNPNQTDDIHNGAANPDYISSITPTNISRKVRQFSSQLNKLKRKARADRPDMLIDERIEAIKADKAKLLEQAELIKTENIMLKAANATLAKRIALTK